MQRPRLKPESELCPEAIKRQRAYIKAVQDSARKRKERKIAIITGMIVLTVIALGIVVVIAIFTGSMCLSLSSGCLIGLLLGHLWADATSI